MGSEVSAIERRASAVDPLSHPIMFEQPRRLTHISSWHGHMPFAMYLVDATRPTTLVELGTHCGDSYCAFCQAVDTCELSTACHAIDTWSGDPQAGFYSDDEVLVNLRSHHDPLYGSFSRLVQTTFDEALPSFEDRSIDVLHIDGYHAYEAVTHDFESWLPKLSERAVVLLHDTNVRDSDFGAWRAWDELADRFPRFEFLHSHGLGVVAVGDDVPDPIRRLVDADDSQTRAVRSLFAALGARVTLVGAHGRTLDRIEELEREREAAVEKLTESAERIRELEKHMSALEGARQSLQADLEARLDRQQQLVAEVLSSRSWRVTAPMRRVARLVR